MGRELVARVAAGERVVFHCVSGKDRTGTAAGLILRGGGVPWPDEVASDEAIARCYADVFGPGSQDALKAALLER